MRTESTLSSAPVDARMPALFGPVEFVAPVLSVLSAVSIRLRGSVVLVRDKLLPSTSLPVNIAVSVTLLASLRVLATMLLPPTTQLRQRRVLLTRVQKTVARWEAVVDKEVLHRCVGICPEEDQEALAWFCRSDAVAAALLSCWHRCAQNDSECQGPFYGIVASTAFASDFDLEAYIELVYTAEQVLKDGDDPEWVTRLRTIVLFAVFRRLAVAEEARHVSGLWQRYVIDASAAAEGAARKVACPFISRPAWRVFGRPTWLVPLAAPTPLVTAWSPHSMVRCYLGMPLSYFPVESVMTHRWEETWLSPDGHLAHALPRWRAQCLASLRHVMSTPAPVDGTDDGARCMAVATKVSYLFLRYGCPLITGQIQRAEQDARRLVGEKLFRGVMYSRSIDDSAMNDEGDEVVYRCASRERRVRVLTGACAACTAVKALMDTWVPRLTTTDFMSMISLSVLSRQAPADAGDGATDSGASSASTTLKDRLANQLLWHLFLSVTTGVAGVLVSRVASSFRAALAQMLSEEFEAQFVSQLHSTDEAFLARLVRDSGVSDALENGADGSKAAVAQQSVAQLMRFVATGGSVVVDHFNRRARRACQVMAVLASTLYYREPLAVCVAVLMAADKHSLIGWVTCWLGFATLDDLASEGMYNCSEEPLPVTCPLGLRLVLDALVDEQVDESQTQGSSRGDLRHPYLALVASSAVWRHKFPVASGVEGSDAAAAEGTASSALVATASTSNDSCPRLPPLRRAAEVALLYQRVSRYGYGNERGTRSASPASRRRIASMLLDVRCILAFPLAELYTELSVGLTGLGDEALNDPSYPQHTPWLRGVDGGPCLDSSEAQLIRTKAAMEYVPSTLDYHELFSASSRFVLRQLGLEMVFAEKTVAGLRQSAPQDASVEVEQLFSSSSFNPLTWLFADLVAAAQTLLIVAASCGVWRDGCLYMQPTDPSAVYAVVGRVERYRRLFLIGFVRSRDTPQLLALRKLQQLCECLPSSISDNATWSRCPAVVERRKAWAAWAAAQSRYMDVDRAGRICGQFRLHTAITVDNAYFAYPQLHHYTDAASSSQHTGNTTAHNCAAHRPVLSAGTCRFPADGMTAVIGPTGSGKSSMVALLGRHYDPLSPLCVAWPQRGGDSATQVVCGSHVELWTDCLLGQLLRLSAVDARFPATPPQPGPLPMSIRETANADPSPDTVLCPRAFLLHDGVGPDGTVDSSCIRLDGIPLACFSVPYLRQWMTHLEQAPHICETLSFFDNVRLLRADVTYGDASQAATMCRCDPFIQNKPQQLLHKCGLLSGGEQQRLALARVVATTQARVRSELLGEAFQSSAQAWQPQPQPQHTGNQLVEHDCCNGALLLDEPTSRLDAFNELQVLGSIEKLSAGAYGGFRLLVISIAHRLSTLRSARHVVVLESGHVTAQGNPLSVVQSNAFAKEQMRLQELS